MESMMGGHMMGGAVWVIGLFGLLLLVVLVLAAAALSKYLFAFRKAEERRDD